MTYNSSAYILLSIFRKSEVQTFENSVVPEINSSLCREISTQSIFSDQTDSYPKKSELPIPQEIIQSLYDQKICYLPKGLCVTSDSLHGRRLHLRQFPFKAIEPWNMLQRNERLPPNKHLVIDTNAMRMVGLQNPQNSYFQTLSKYRFPNEEPSD